MSAASVRRFKKMLPHTIGVIAYTGTAPDGTRQYSTNVFAEYPCLIQEQIRVVRNTEGNDVIVSRTAYVLTDGVYIAPESKFRMFDGKVEPAATVSNHYDIDGVVNNVEITFS